MDEATLTDLIRDHAQPLPRYVTKLTFNDVHLAECARPFPDGRGRPRPARMSGVQIPARLGMRMVDQPGDQEVAAASGNHCRVAQDDVQRVGHAGPAAARRRFSSASRAACSASLGS
jgi:hypothetical protein